MHSFKRYFSLPNFVVGLLFSSIQTKCESNSFLFSPLSRTSLPFNSNRSQSSRQSYRSKCCVMQWKSNYLCTIDHVLNQSFSSEKVRKIIVELQRLFAEMLLLNQQACSSIRLTDSFGWQSNEVDLFFFSSPNINGKKIRNI